MKDIKLKIFDINNVPQFVAKGKPFIHFNKAAAELLGLKAGSALKLAQDENRLKDWYIIPGVSDKEGFVIRKKTETTLQFNCKGLSHLILTSAQSAANGGRIGIGAEPITYEGKLSVWSLITSMLANGKESVK